ncbi:RNA ligase family protein [Streptomyces sp. NPDC002952]|uniref:RNA ligase family protein n=1 Tax=Streptomyces sp. NPDC002952 TaxID=3364673 RepID=UPI0036AB917F
MHEFTPWPKTKRLFRDIVVTEKIDGTNAAVHITAVPHDPPGELVVYPGEWVSPVVDGVRYVVSAQSRTRIISPGKTTDNYGFAAWVYEHVDELVRLLGEGIHFGEWWGRGIQRNYGMEGRRFSLFNTERYDHLNHDDAAMFGSSRVNTVPVLYSGTFSEADICRALADLKEFGSHAAPAFDNPEGVCVYHTQTRNVFKVTLDNNDAGKWEAAA